MIDGATSTIVWQGIPSRGAPLQHQTLTGNTRLGNETLPTPPSLPLHSSSSSAAPAPPQASIARAPVLPDLMGSAASHLPSLSLIGRSTSSSSSSAAVRHAVDLEWLRGALQDFLRQHNPGKLHAVPGLVKQFGLNGATLDELELLNQDLRQRYGLNLPPYPPPDNHGRHPPSSSPPPPAPLPPQHHHPEREPSPPAASSPNGLHSPFPVTTLTASALRHASPTPRRPPPETRPGPLHRSHDQDHRVTPALSARTTLAQHDSEANNLIPLIRTTLTQHDSEANNLIPLIRTTLTGHPQRDAWPPSPSPSASPSASTSTSPQKKGGKEAAVPAEGRSSAATSPRKGAAAPALTGGRIGGDPPPEVSGATPSGWSAVLEIAGEVVSLGSPSPPPGGRDGVMSVWASVDGAQWHIAGGGGASGRSACIRLDEDTSRVRAEVWTEGRQEDGGGKNLLFAHNMSLADLLAGGEHTVVASPRGQTLVTCVQTDVSHTRPSSTTAHPQSWLLKLRLKTGFAHASSPSLFHAAVHSMSTLASGKLSHIMASIGGGVAAPDAGRYGGVFEADALRKQLAEKNAEIEMLRGLITNGSSIGDTDPLVVQKAKRERERCRMQVWTQLRSAQAIISTLEGGGE